MEWKGIVLNRNYANFLGGWLHVYITSWNFTFRKSTDPTNDSNLHKLHLVYQLKNIMWMKQTIFSHEP